MMAYIEIEKAIAEIDKGDLLVGNNAEWAKEILYRTPTADVVEVVRCSECVNGKKAVINDKGFKICPASGMEIADNDYCSYGERRTDDD